MQTVFRAAIMASNVFTVIIYLCNMERQSVSHLGDSFRVGMWQARWKTLGHLSQQSSSPPFWQTAHQSSLGSSSGSTLFSDSGCAAGWGRCSFPALDSDPVAGTGPDTFCCCRGFDWAPVLLSGRLDPTLDCTCRQRKGLLSSVSWGWTKTNYNMTKYYFSMDFKNKAILNTFPSACSSILPPTPYLLHAFRLM